MEDSEIVSIVNQNIQERRSTFVRQFVPGKQVSELIIRKALENACYAPNHKQLEPWRFTVYCGEGLKRLASQQAEIYKANAGVSFKQMKYDQLLNAPLECSHVIAIGCKRTMFPEMEDVAAIGCAVQNIYLTLTAYNVGCYWSTGGITYMEATKELFNLHSADVFMGFVYIGHIQTPSPQRRPNDIEGKITWVKE